MALLNQSAFVLQENLVEVWFADLSLLGLEQACCYDLLDSTERSIANGFRSPLLGNVYIQGHGLLRLLLSRYLQVSPASLRIERSTHGKPYLLDYPELRFNLSHTGSKWLLAIATAVPLGVDIEVIQPRSQMAGLVARCFAPEEQAVWQALPEDKKLSAFFEFWTRKEAFVKAVGRGIALGLNHCVIDPRKSQCFLRVPIESGSAELWRFKDLRVDAGCRAAVVVRLSDCAVKVWTVKNHLQYLL